VEAVTPPAPPSLPAACADCLQTTLSALAGVNPIQMALQQFRSAEGKLRINFGTTSLIINPLAQVRILLDHLALTARILSSAAGPPGVPGIPPLPSPPIGLEAELSLAGAAAQIVQLGKAFMEGLEVEGMRYLFPPGGAVLSWEVWTSIRLQLPVMTRTIGSFGERTCICKCTPVPPPPAIFEIPAGYVVINPPAPH
jgi:hypothetical protein